MNLLKRIGFFALTNIAVIAIFSIILAIVGYFFPQFNIRGEGIIQMLVYAAIFGFVGAFFSLAISRWSAKNMYGIELLDASSASQNAKLQLVYQTVERIARENNIQMPEVGMYEDATPNAFATGPTKNSALVAVSTGLLNSMEWDEIEGVVGHEMAHILNGDMVTMTLLQGVINTFVIFFARLVMKFITDRFGDSIGLLAYNVIYIALQIVFGFLGSFIVNYYSRVREYHADAGGAKYTSKAKMIAGLKRLQTLTRLESSEENAEKNKKMSTLLIANPSEDEKDSIFSTHPSLSNRIKSLENNALIA